MDNEQTVSYNKVLEVKAIIANSKLGSSATFTPNDNHQHILTTAVYDNIDRLQETLSGCDTKHWVNGAVVHQAFISPSLSPVISRMEKTKNQSTEVLQHALPNYNAGRKLKVFVLSCPDQK